MSPAAELKAFLEAFWMVKFIISAQRQILSIPKENICWTFPVFMAIIFSEISF